jgi:hypothetical protein
VWLGKRESRYIAEQECYVLSGDHRFAVTGLTDDELLGQATATGLTSAIEQSVVAHL